MTDKSNSLVVKELRAINDPLCKRMKPSIVFILLATLLFSCKNDGMKHQYENTRKSDMKFIAKKHKNRGVILTESLDIYNRSLKKIGVATNTMGLVIAIDSVSMKKFSLVKSEERCDLHNFVYVKSATFNGWVYGQFVFEEEKLNRDTSFTIDNIHFEIIPTKNFGIGVYDEQLDGLSFCGKGNQSPILLFNSKYKKYECVWVDKGESYIEGYVTLDNHDGWTDKIKSARFSNDSLVLGIEREYQEDGAYIGLLINLDPKHLKATSFIKFENRE